MTIPVFMPVPSDAGPRAVAAAADLAEDAGYDGIAVSETAHDPTIGLTLAAAATTRIALSTSVLIAFARNPMTVAMLSADVQEASQGRFVLGLGSQVQPHIEHRFSMPWSRPADRMREFVVAVRTVWRAFDSGDVRLRHRGEFYRHTLLTPAFDPGPSEYPRPPIWVAGVGERMTQVAGEVADGFIAHPFTTARFVEEVSLPALRSGAERVGRDPDAVGLTVSPLVALGEGNAEIAAAQDAVRRRLAFYGSTPTYRSVLERHGWAHLADELGAGARRGRWEGLGALIGDDVLSAFAAVGTPAQVANWIRARYGATATRLSFSVANEPRADLLRQLGTELRRS